MHNEDILEAIRPFVEAKVHNPNRSKKPTTARVINVPANAIALLEQVYIQLSAEAPKADTSDVITQLLTALSIQERDSRIYFREIELLKAAGIVSDEAQASAEELVRTAWEKGDRFLDEKVIREDLVKRFLPGDDDA